MAKENIIETLGYRLTLPAESEAWTQDEQAVFLNVLAERLTELHATLGIDSIKAKSTGVTVKGSGEQEYNHKNGDWRDAVLSVVCEAARVGPFCGLIRVDVSERALNWAARRREKKASAK